MCGTRLQGGYWRRCRAPMPALAIAQGKKAISTIASLFVCSPQKRRCPAQYHTAESLRCRNDLWGPANRVASCEGHPRPGPGVDSIWPCWCGPAASPTPVARVSSARLSKSTYPTPRGGGWCENGVGTPIQAEYDERPRRLGFIEMLAAPYGRATADTNHFVWKDRGQPSNSGT
jgi:hypothetical protein